MIAGMTMVATAYCDRGDVAISKSRIASYRRVFAGASVVAVDPHVIPLGSHILVNGVRKWAADTGGNIRGSGSLRPGATAGVDLWMGSCDKAIAWGRRNVSVILLASNDRYPEQWRRRFALAPKTERKSSSIRNDRGSMHSLAASSFVNGKTHSAYGSGERSPFCSVALLLMFISLGQSLRDLLPITRCKRCGKMTRKPTHYSRFRQPLN